MKKIKIFLIAVLALGFVFGGCNQPTEVELFRTLNGTTIRLYESVNLYISERCELDQISFTSSEESVISVENGRLVANSVGQAEITATWNGITQKLVYTVTAEDMEWALSVRETVMLAQNQTFTLTPQLTLSGNEYENATFTYATASAAIATVAADGTVTAVAKGSTDIVVSAFVDDKQVATQTVLCSIVDNVGIYPSQTEYTLYLLDSIRGQSFDKQLPLSASVYSDGEIVENASVEWSIDDESVASLGENDVLSAVKAGSTYIVGTSTINGKEYKTQKITVNVEIPLINLKDDVIVDLSKTTQILDSFALFGDGYSVGSIYDVSKNKTIALTNGAVRTDAFKAGEHSCIVYNTDKTVGAIVNLVAADFVVYDIDDLKKVTLAEHKTHYIALADDIEINGSYQSESSSTSFEGTFNGLGHVLLGMKLDKYHAGGLFMSLAGGTVKNLAFLDAEISNTNNALIAYAHSYQTSVIDNIYAEITFKGNNIGFAAGLVSFGHVGQITITNTLLKVSGLEDEQRGKDNGLAVGRLYYCRAALNNFYVIGQGLLCGQKANPYNSSYASLNQNVSCIYPNAEQFAKEREKDMPKVDLSGFNQYWDTEGEKLCFKACKNYED